MKNGEGKKKFHLKVKRYPDTSLLPQFICSGSLGRSGTRSSLLLVVYRINLNRIHEFYRFNEKHRAVCQ